ncbi:MAG: glutaredoxin 3 [Gammaproteobacteria bacterium]|jgi:glutaredoxin 3|nr:glutaredoxin 3 [Gammaproteobacteria bacterium]
MANVEIYTTQICPYCVRAKMLLDRKGISYTELRVDLDSELRLLMEQRSGRRTVPQIFIDNRHIGGCDDLYALEAEHKLDPLLQ